MTRPQPQSLKDRYLLTNDDWLTLVELSAVAGLTPKAFVRDVLTAFITDHRPILEKQDTTQWIDHTFACQWHYGRDCNCDKGKT